MKLVHTHRAPQAGSVLVPVVVAMLLLLMTGIGLVELFGAQQVQSVDRFESARGHWIAEAGARHAAFDGTGIDTTIAFAGGVYSTTKVDDTYRSTGRLRQTRRTVEWTVASGGGGGPVGPSPIDEAASVARARKRGRGGFDLPLISQVSEDVVVRSFALSCDSDGLFLERLRLDNADIFRERYDPPLPTGDLWVVDYPESRRTIDGFDDPRLRVHTDPDLFGRIEFTIILDFTNDTQTTLVVELVW